ETEGYTSLHMPWPRNTPAEMKEFVADSHVAPLLARWNVAFKADLTPTAEAGEEPYARNIYTTCGNLASNPAPVNKGAGQDCTQLFGQSSVNTCNSNGTNSKGCAVVADTTTYANETRLLQCCASSTWFVAEK